MRRVPELVILLALVAGPVAAAAPPAAPRFFLAGDGQLALEDAHAGARVALRFRHSDGTYDARALAELRRFLGSPAGEREADLSLRLIELIDHVEDLVRPRRLVLVSGYRSPQRNAALREAGRAVARASLHTEGLAADLRVEGVDLERLWRRLRERECCGVGLYRASGFVHLDVGPPRFWEAATSRVGENLSHGNARLFARTDYDRYPRLAGARLRLHGLTVTPVGIGRRLLVDGLPVATLTPVGAGVAAEANCYVISTRDAPAIFAVEETAVMEPAPGRRHLQLATCPPRPERTPALIEVNPIAVVPAR
jgi:uncharacterized protein YcbK (DUF882 family)